MISARRRQADLLLGRVRPHPAALALGEPAGRGQREPDEEDSRERASDHDEPGERRLRPERFRGAESQPDRRSAAAAHAPAPHPALAAPGPRLRAERPRAVGAE